MKTLIVFLLLAQFCVNSQAQTAHAVALIYHHVDIRTPALTSISPQQFEQQLDYVEANGFVVMALPELVQRMAAGKPLPDKVLTFTFDDAYESIYTTVYPLFKKRGWPFTVFVSTDPVDKAYGLQSSWPQLREMAANRATIANHSASHQHLAVRLDNETEAAWRQRVTADINRAQARIKTEIGSSPKLFAYPYGEYDRALQAIVKALGYTAFGQQSGAWGLSSDPQAIPRFAFGGAHTDIKEFAVKIGSLPFTIIASKATDNPLPHKQSRPELILEFAEGNYQALTCFGSGQGALPLEWLAKTSVLIKPAKDIPVGRSRINCTLPAGNGRFYWYSHQWIRLNKNNQWILD